MFGDIASGFNILKSACSVFFSLLSDMVCICVAEWDLDLAGTDQSQWWGLKVKGQVPISIHTLDDSCFCFKMMDTTLSAWAPRQLHLCFRLETLFNESSVLFPPVWQWQTKIIEKPAKNNPLAFARSPNCSGLRGQKNQFSILLHDITSSTLTST